MKDKVTKAQAKKMVLVKDDGMVHTFYNISFALVGGDHSKASVFKDIDNSFVCKRGGPQAEALGHCLVVVPSKNCVQSDLLFVETRGRA